MNLLDDITRQKRIEAQIHQAEDAARADLEREFRRDCLAVLQRLKELQCEVLLTEVRDTVWQCGEIVTFVPAELKNLPLPVRWGPPGSSSNTIRAAMVLRAKWPAGFVAASPVRLGVPNIEGDCDTELVPDHIRFDSTELPIFGFAAHRSQSPSVRQLDITIQVGWGPPVSVIADSGDSIGLADEIRQAVVAQLAAMSEPEVHKLRDRAEHALVRELAAQVQSGYRKLDSEFIAQYPGLREKVAAELATLAPPSPPAPPPKRPRFGRR